MLFVSDVHLTPREPEIFLSFCRFIDGPVVGCRALYVLGDLFDFWIGRKQLRIPGYSEILSRLKRVSDSGTDVYFLPGNRDYALCGRFPARYGIKVLPDVAEIQLGDRKVLLTHGDLLCTRDVAYHRMRRILRSRPARWLLAALPLSAGLLLAGGLRQASGTKVRAKPQYMIEPDYEEARAWLARGCDTLVFGHVHKGEKYRLDVGGRRADVFVLGSWESIPNYVEWDGETMELHAYRNSLPGTVGRLPLAPSSPADVEGVVPDRIVIAIDGPSGSGKSTVARRLADRLGYQFLDSGAMYRAVALLALRRGVSAEDEEALSELARSTAIDLVSDRVFADGEDVSAEIRSREVTSFVARVAAVPGVREAMVAKQRVAHPESNLVVEGRDIGSVVFPDAAVKFFLTASPEVRARRRALQTGGEMEEVLAEQRIRDAMDESREHSPLVRADGAVEVDTTELSIEEVVRRLAERIQRTRGSSSGGPSTTSSKS